jgi:hypothetical protein
MVEIACLWHVILMSKPARSDLFSWRLPFFFTLLLIGGMGASFAWANSGPARFYTDPSHAVTECNTAASIAAELAAKQPDATFRATLVGIAPDPQSTLLYRSARALLIWPLEFDCSDAFAKRGLTIAADSPSGNVWPARYRFSRIALSDDGHVAVVAVVASCGGECAGGFEEIWRQEGRRWVMVKRVSTWIT